MALEDRVARYLSGPNAVTREKMLEAHARRRQRDREKQPSQQSQYGHSKQDVSRISETSNTKSAQTQTETVPLKSAVHQDEQQSIQKAARKMTKSISTQTDSDLLKRSDGKGKASSTSADKTLNAGRTSASGSKALSTATNGLTKRSKSTSSPSTHSRSQSNDENKTASLLIANMLSEHLSDLRGSGEARIGDFAQKLQDELYSIGKGDDRNGMFSSMQLYEAIQKAAIRSGTHIAPTANPITQSDMPAEIKIQIYTEVFKVRKGTAVTPTWTPDYIGGQLTMEAWCILGEKAVQTSKNRRFGVKEPSGRVLPIHVLYHHKPVKKRGEDDLYYARSVFERELLQDYVVYLDSEMQNILLAQQIYRFDSDFLRMTDQLMVRRDFNRLGKDRLLTEDESTVLGRIYKEITTNPRKVKRVGEKEAEKPRIKHLTIVTLNDSKSPNGLLVFRLLRGEKGASDRYAVCALQHPASGLPFNWSGVRYLLYDWQLQLNEIYTPNRKDLDDKIWMKAFQKVEKLRKNREWDLYFDPTAIARLGTEVGPNRLDKAL